MMKLYMLWILFQQTWQINSHGKKVTYRIDCYILHTDLLVILLIFPIAIIFYHYPRLKTRTAMLKIKKYGIMNFKKYI